METPESCVKSVESYQLRRLNDTFIVDFEQASHIFVLFPLLPSSKLTRT